MLSIGWFSTGRGQGSLGLLRFIQERISQGVIDADIQFVFSNREPGEADGSDHFLDQVRSYSIPLTTCSSRKFRRSVGGDFASHRIEYDREVLKRLEGFAPDVCVLAGYMLIVGGEMCRKYTMLNLHPALPTGPVGTWQEVIWSLIESEASETGAMTHLVTEEVDRGPVVSCFTMPITGGAWERHWNEVNGKNAQRLKSDYGEDLPLFQAIRQEEYKREPYLLATTLSALAKGEIRIKNGEALDSKGSRIQGVCLNSEIEEALAES